MTVWNTWLGRRLCLPLATVLIASTCHAATLSETSSGNLHSPTQAQDTSSPAQGQSIPVPSGAAPGSTGQAPQSPSTPPPNFSSPITRPQDQAPIVRPAPPAGQSGESAVPPAQAPAPVQDQTPPQQFNKDQQYSTPAATQQLIPRTAGGQPVAPPAEPPTPPPGPPVGTAAAPVIKSTGTAGSRVAGAAVAPAKQRRIRTLAIRAALVVGAAVAIGIVIGASKASPARAQ